MEHNPKNICMLLVLPNVDQTMGFFLSYFRPDPNFYPPVDLFG